MANRVYVHIGTPKSGTSFLQSVLWKNREALAGAGVLLPLDGVERHYELTKAGPTKRGGSMADARAAADATWKALAEEVVGWRGDVLISHELFSHARKARVRWMLSELSRLGEVHIVMTARDLARQIPAAWQQSVKHGRTHSLSTYYELIRDHDPSIAFWRGQDLPNLATMWGSELSPGQVHIVTVPPADSSPDQLWQRYSGLIGLGSTPVELAGARPNASLGTAEIELVRRVNEVAGDEVPGRAMRTRLVPILVVANSRPEQFATPDEHQAWVADRAVGMVRRIATLGCDVVGSLDDLLPTVRPAIDQPELPGDAIVLRTAIEAITALLRGPAPAA